LYENGYAVRENNEQTSAYFEKELLANSKDKPTGFIYVLKSHSDLPEIKSLENLYKIGFSTTSVEKRIANAEKEPTFLFGKVKVVATWKAYNLNVSLFESMIHKVFNDVRLQVHIGQIVPEEWFIIPFPVIEKAIQCIIREIPISYDAAQQIIVEHTMLEQKNQPAVDTTGWKILRLNVKEAYFNQIVDGTKKKEIRLLKPSTINQYTYWDEGKRWLKKFNAIQFMVGYHKSRKSVLVEVIDTKFDVDKQTIEFTLGKIYENS
jgi:hypothetical protein